MSQTILFKEECYRIVGAAFEVFNELGHGFLEPVYQEALEIEFASQGTPFIAQQPLRIAYKGRQLLERSLSKSRHSRSCQDGRTLS